MKKLALLLLLLSYFAASAQHPLSQGRRASVYDYLYTLSNEEVLQICSRGPGKINNSFLHTLTDSFPHDKGVPAHLPPGNYLRVYAENDQLQAVSMQVPNVLVNIADNNHDLIVILRDQKGNPVTEARVKIRRHTLEHDTRTGAWVLKKYDRRGLLQVYYKGVLNCISLTGNRYRKMTPFARISQRIGVIRWQLKGRRRDYYDTWNVKGEYEQRHRGYMVFSKPIYKPGDTLKVKAYITDKKGKPVNEPLLLRISDKGYSTDTIVTTLKPYTPGGYSYEVVITPDLDLLLDDDYMITLETPDSRKYDLSKYEGDLDEEEYAAKRKVLMRGKFTLEEYELHTLHFTARSDNELHTSREKLAVYLQAKDENDLPVLDGQIQLFLTQPIIVKSYSEDVLVPDTLWQYKGPIDVLGETKVIIPDSIFPKADLLYQIECILTNSNNEQKRETLRQQYRYDQGRFSFDIQDDSLYITMKGGDKTDSNVRIYGLNDEQDTVETFVRHLPAAIKINPIVSSYDVLGKNAKDRYTLKNDADFLSCKIDWRNDTAIIHVNNPHKQHFWYTISERGKIQVRGYSDTLSWQGSTRHNKQYKLYLSYLWKGTIHNVPVLFKDPGGKLNITVDAPRIIYPGQTTQVTVNVRDKYQRPVANADVTSYAYTNKFTDDQDPVIPAFTTRFKKDKNYRSLKTLPTPEGSRPLLFEWERYGRRMGLDSLLFFRFTHPSPIFTYTEPTEDHSAQIAPFVFSRGSIQPVHILYVDEVPVYYSLTSPVQPYSIKVSPGKHKIKFRTAYQQITMEQIFPDNVKTFISIDSAIRQENVLVQTVPQRLTPQEIARVENYVIYLNATFGDHPVYIRQQNQIYNVNAYGHSGNSYYPYTVGPLRGFNASLVVKDTFTQDFIPEAGYSFEISKGLIKQKQYTLWEDYNLLSHKPDTSLSAQALTEKSIDSTLIAMQDDRLRRVDVIPVYRDDKSYLSRLSIRIAHPGINPAVDVLGFLFFRYDDPSFMRSFKGHTTEFQYLDSGYYKLLVLVKGNRYFLKDSILLKQNHQHHYTFDTLSILKQDIAVTKLEKELRKTADRGISSWNIPEQRREMAETFNTDFIQPSQFTRVINGRLVDQKGDPLPGVSVLLKGSKSGTLTDANGNFVLHVTPNGTLLIRYIGFSAVEQKLTNEDFYKITLTEDTKALQEVVVTAYGKRKEKKVVYTSAVFLSDQISASNISNFAPALYGKVAGVQISVPPGALHFTPTSTVAPENELTTEGSKETNQLPTPPANSLRTNFRDNAFWQPRLRTDANGNASFNVAFPDDITNWKTYTIAMNGKQQSGINRTFIRSYKALSGNLALPLFAVEGDSLAVISKALNYTQETIAATHSFSVNDSLYKTANISFKNAFIDTFPVVISDEDSVSFKYILNKDGYIDGEERKVPVVKRGTEETAGMFAALYNDTSFTYTSSHIEPLQVHAESAVLPVLMDEITQVQRYKYLCNEQLASKLKAYLLEKRIAVYQKKEFKKDDDIKNILNKLDRQKKNGLWGWWENSPVSLWISRHVTEALLMAEEQGYKTSFNKQVAIDYFVDKLNSGKEHDSTTCIELLASLGAKINYATCIDSIIARSGRFGYDTVRLTMLQRQVGLPLNLLPILAREKNTVFGNAYWGNESYHMFDNSIQKTLQVYKLLRKAGGYENLLQKMRGYFLEQRKDGHWRNTYESSLILETILPDVLEDESHGPAALDINGRHITQFPYTDTLIHAEKINISKQGKRPVYFTAYQQFFNPLPEKVSGLFNVSSVFSANGATQKDLKAGVPVTLKVEVTVQKTADYVMIEIPIPAGCSYQDKSQSWANNEVHREHFKDRVSIFCSQLRPGTYTFDVSLLPRYSGYYHLNPAKAEMQYFPVFMGREALKKVNIH